MKAKFFIPSLIVLCQFLSSCLVTYGDYTTSQYTKIIKEPCLEKDSVFYMFYNGEPIDFKYEKIGEIEAKGDKNASNEEILNYLKYDAWNNCANGIINIKSGFQERESGTILYDENPQVYNSKYYTALAVKIKRDSLFLSQYGKGVDTSFVSKVRKMRLADSKRTDQQFGASIFGGIIGLIIVAIIASNP